jgi:putative transposase
MTESSMTLGEYLRKISVDLDGDFLREGVQLLLQLAMEEQVTERVGAAKYQRTPERKTQRNGYRPVDWDTRVGSIELQIPKLRDGTYYPNFLEPRRRAEKALLAVIQQAYIEGVSTRKVDDLLQSLGVASTDKSLVSRACKELDELIEEFRNRPLESSYPYVWFDAIYLKVRQNHRIVSLAAVIAIGISETGERRVLGLQTGASESEPFWSEFLRSLVGRGLKGVQLVISDSHEGLKAAIAKVLSGASWQRCRVHFMRNLLAHVPQKDKSLVAAVVRMVFAQPNRKAAGQQLAETVQAMQARWPKAAELLASAENDILAYMAFPPEHWTRIYSTNPLERLNREIKRRTEVVGVFPNEAAVVRLVGAVLMERADEWEVERRPFSLESMHKLTAPDPEAVLQSEARPLRLAPVH